MHGTVQQFKDALEIMRNVYPFKDDETRMGTEDPMRMSHDTLYLDTVDKPTGVRITMSRRVNVTLEDKING